MGFTQPTPSSNDSNDVSDDRRAALLEEWLFAYEQEFGIRPKLMPLDDEGKFPIARNRFSVFKEVDGEKVPTEQANRAVVSGEEAAERIQNGANGFVCYAGRPEWGTEDVAFADHDDPEAFPVSTGEPTLTVATRQGYHEHYRNDSDDPVRNSKVGPDNDQGEIRAYNQYVLVPGSIHPSGFVYQIIENRPIQTLSDTELDDKHRPAGSISIQNPDTHPVLPEAQEAEFGDIDKDAVDSVFWSVREGMKDSPDNGTAIREWRNLKNGAGGGFESDDGSIDRNRAEMALFNFTYGIVKEYGDMTDSEAVEAVGQFVTYVLKQNKWTEDQQLRKWLERPGHYRNQTASRAIQNHDHTLWKGWFYSTGNDGGYGWTRYQNVMLATRVASQVKAEYEPEQYPNGRRVRQLAQKMDSNPLGDDSYRKILSEIVKDHGQIKMAYCGGNDYRYYPRNAPDPEEAEWIKVDGVKREA